MTFQSTTVARWKRRFVGCLALAMLAMLLTGAKEVTNGLMHRPARCEQAAASLLMLGRQIAQEMPGNAVADRLSPRHAMSLIRACSRQEDLGHEQQPAPIDVARK